MLAGKTAMRLIFIMLLLYCFLVPVARLIWLSFSTPSGTSFENYRSTLSDASTWRAVGNTMYISVASTIIAVFLGVSAAWLVAYSNVRGKSLMQPLIVLPFILPPFIVTLAWAEAFDNNGIITAAFGGNSPFDLYNLNGISFVLGLTHYPIVYLLTVTALRRIPRETEQAARAAGANFFTTVRKVTLVGALPGIAGGALLAFLTALDNFGVPAFLGIPAHITVLSTDIYQQIVGFGPSAFNRAAALSALLGLIAVTGTVGQALIVRRSRGAENLQTDPSPRVILRRSRASIESITWILLVGSVLVPVLSMVRSSLSKAVGVKVTFSTASLDNYRFLLSKSAQMQHAMVTSGKLALFSMLVCMVVGTFIAYLRVRKSSMMVRILDASVALPYALPGVVMALAIIFAWVQPIPGFFPGIYGTWLIILVAYITRFTFYQVRSSAAALSQIDPSVEEAARASGAGTVEVWRRVMLPLIGTGIAAGALLVLVTALAELTVSSILYSEGSETIGVMIFSFQQAGYLNYATAAGTLVLIAYAAIGLIGLIGRSLWRRKFRVG